MSKRVSIYYGDIAVGAKDAFVPYTTDIKDFSDVSQIKTMNLAFPNIGNPCELFAVALDGSMDLFTDTHLKNTGWWSNSMTDASGVFETPPQLILTADEYFSSPGIALTFDRYNGIFPTLLQIQWYHDDNLIDDQTFAPNDYNYFCQHRVFDFNKIIITFKTLNMPHNRLKMYGIEYGYGTFFTGGMLTNVKISQMINPISTELPGSTCDFSLMVKADMDYSFQNGQPLKTYYDGKLKSMTYISNFKRSSKDVWEISSEDAILLLDRYDYVGDLFFENYGNPGNAYAVLEKIFQVANVAYEIDEGFKDVTLYGYIPYGTCREALQQVAFATGSVVDTSCSEKIKVKAPEAKVTQNIPKNRILQGQTSSVDETITGVTLSVYQLTRCDVNDPELYEKIFRNTSTEPLENYIVTAEGPSNFRVRDRSGKLLTSNIIQTGSNAVVCNIPSFGYVEAAPHSVYKMSRSLKQEQILSAIENIAEIQDCTLINANNYDAVLHRCYDWLITNNKLTAKIAESKHVIIGEKAKFGIGKYGMVKYAEVQTDVVSTDTPVELGDVISVDTEYSGKKVGTVVKATYNLNGNIIVKEVDIH